MILLTIAHTSFAQGVKGFVMDEENNALPFVNVYIKFTSIGTTTDIQGRYFLKLDPGEHTLVYSIVGYEKKEVQIVVKQSQVVKNTWLKPSNETLNEVVIKSRRRDPAFDIIKQAIEQSFQYRTLG